MSLQQELEKTFGGPVAVRAGAPGSLTVHLDGERIFSRKEQNQPVSNAAIVELVRARVGAGGG